MQPSQTVKLYHNQTITTSYQIAQVFEKSHNDVVKDIEKLLGKIDDELIKRHFKPAFKIKYINHTQYKMSYYTLTKDGFILLAINNQTYATNAKIDPLFIFNQPHKNLTQERFYGLFSNFKTISKILRLVLQIFWIIDKIIQMLPPII